MKSTIDSAGRVVVPKAIRDRLGLTGGQEVEIREGNGVIEISAAATPMSLRRTEEGGLVAVPEKPLPPLTDEMVRATLEQTRR